MSSPRGLDVRTEIDLPGEPESLIFLTLPTPNEGHRYDLSAFTAGSAAVGKALAGSSARHTVVVRSTVPPGTTEGLVKTTLERNSEDRLVDVAIEPRRGSTRVRGGSCALTTRIVLADP